MQRTIAKSRWYRLIPIVFITYSLAYLDRANYGFGAAGGLAEDLHISAATSSLLGSLFFLGYFFFQVPGAHYAENKSAKKLIFWSLILWGGLASATGIVSNIQWLMIIRFLLGVVESAVMPSMLVFLSHWFTKEERSRANTFLILGNPATVLWMSILSGYLIEAVGWRWMFIAEGVPAIIWAFIWWKLVNDEPKEAKWLTDEEKQQLQAQLEREQQELTPVKNYSQAFRSKTVILLSLQYALWSIGVYGFVMWLPSIIHAAPNMDIVKTGWLSSVPYVLAIIFMFAASYYSDKLLNRTIFVWPFLLVGAITFYASYMIGTSHFWISFFLLVVAGAAMYAPYGPFFAIIPEILPRNVAGGAMALINSMGALGSFVGSYIVGYLNGATGGFGASYIFMAGSLFFAAIFTMMAVKGQQSLKKKRVPEQWEVHQAHK
ncbi:sugar (and other) transporter family protein [Anoxybacillus sp. B7M1]|jgi:sugar phosphate permease|uniref:MFS transporter n=1 Tax=Anoxybacteroides rupiense TaxID=311460 RepID=A0ABD5IT39_9BACL|nr:MULTISPECIES: MFS transporter [Anoxybacillus]ANB56877.1 sugar (and other) transporter family protein [Anoxybacillus sp. B2M1]ANB63548.1 sugar (and other) transporter family protein [Anoxybacillus sp. B7M1]MBB3908059.1 sugar phosphate permease [Anoxybacillus rupiensis]MED5051368.1 MFS transporter [Anoxybacillus rupiensis]QHC04180.1 MFS transporter [Anoxybacillus sp. PDR2]